MARKIKPRSNAKRSDRPSFALIYYRFLDFFFSSPKNPKYSASCWPFIPVYEYLDCPISYRSSVLNSGEFSNLFNFYTQI